MPFNTDVLEYVHREKRLGRRIVLATAAPAKVAQAVATHLGLFDDVIASDGTRNVKGSEKLKVIRERVGKPFVYVGDSTADLAVWNEAQGAILVGRGTRFAHHVEKRTPIVKHFPGDKATLTTWITALRVHQWLKNVLLFVPLLASFGFLDPSRLLANILAFIAFSLAASGTYLLNDIWDIESDRTHPRKRARAIACARISVLSAIAVAVLLLTSAFTLSLSVSPLFGLMLAIYVLLTTTYSWVLKRVVLADVLILSLLYTLRILAGAVAIRVIVSSWLLAFSVFMFFSLALVKRCSELVSLGQAGRSVIRGRGYLVSDLRVLWPLGTAAAMASVVVFGLFISAPETEMRYATTQLLWLAAVALIYWLSHLWIKTSRGEIHDDPLVFAIRDRTSQVTMFAIVLITIGAHYLEL
jgi:4-hydroxybenzoate polyprenyltransferase